MKDLSIPRLEILACVLLSKLVVSVINAGRLEVQVRNVFCWTDGQIAVCGSNNQINGGTFGCKTGQRSYATTFHRSIGFM